MPLFWISLGFLCGIYLAHSVAIPTLGWSIPGMIGSVLLILSIKGILFKGNIQQKQPWQTLFLSPNILCMMMVTLSLGALRFQTSKPKIDPSFIAFYNDQTTKYIVDGILVEPPDVRDTYTNLHLKVKSLQAVGEETFTTVKGIILVRISGHTEYRYGDLIRLEGRIVSPAENEDFSYREYLMNQGIYSYIAYPSAQLLQHGQGNPLKSILYAFKQHAVDKIYTFYPDPEAALLAGILLGVEAGIPLRVQDAFRLTGTSHIIVISGFNITIIAALFTLTFSRIFGKRKGAIAAGIGIILYTLLVGANAAVVRAAFLGLLTLLGHQFGRRQLGLNSLVFTAVSMAAITPGVLWDISFQLSFAATLGIMLYAEPLTNWFIHLAAGIIPQDKAEKLAGPVGEYFLLTLAAQLTTLPLMIYYFKRISLSSLIANPLILPAQPPIMVLGGISVVGGMIFKPFGQFMAWITWPFMAFTIRVVEWLARIPHSSIVLGQMALLILFIFYGILFTVTFFHSQIIPFIKSASPTLPLSFLAIATVLVWKAASYAPDGKLHVTLLDVGTGDGVLLQSPAGRQVLINGGPSTIKLSDALGRRLPFYNRNLDWLVVADIDDEDLAGVATNFERFTPHHVLWAGSTYGTRSARDLWSAMISLSTPVDMMQTGQSLDLGEGIALTVLSTNERGAVLMLQWEDFSMLLPLGLDFKSMGEILADSSGRNISVLMLAESGYAPLNTEELISYLNPQVALLSVSATDKNGLPSPDTLTALNGYTLLRTDRNGWVEITTDGKQMWVEVERR